MKKILGSVLFVGSLFLTLPSKAQFTVPTPDGEMATLVMAYDLQIFPSVQPTLATLNLVSSSPGFQVYQVTLDYPAAGKIRLLLRGPSGFMARQDLHAMMIVSGFFTGEQSVHLIGDFPDKVVVGFEYPYGVSEFQNDPATILQFMGKTPGQIALALRWLCDQTWMKNGGLSVMGVSLGGVFLPAGIHLSQLLNVQLEHTIFVGTGTELATILRENLREYVKEPLLSPLVEALALPTVLMDPKKHLPYLKGPSLIIQTAQDTVIPLASKQSLMDSLGGIKSEVVLPGPHINSDQADLIQKIQEIVLKHLN